MGRNPIGSVFSIRACLNPINWLQVANFILNSVKKPRHTLLVCLRFLPYSEKKNPYFRSIMKI